MKITHITLHKKRGETPLQTIRNWKAKNPELTSLPASYAGRLDPMAEGKLLVLLGDECKNQEKYRGLDKEYEIEVVFDISTDSGDVLGIPTYSNLDTDSNKKALLRALTKVSGSHTVPYPKYSSKTVNGKPLFLYTLEGTLDTIKVPEHMETIYRSKILGVKKQSIAQLKKTVTKNLEVVPYAPQETMSIGRDFRQDEIRTKWNELFTTIPDRTFTVLSLRITCASGTYMRTLAERLAKELGTTGFALSINRTRIGKYRSLGGLGIWLKKY